MERIATTAAGRISRSLEAIDDRFALPGAALDEQLTREEILREIEETGHIPPGDGCTRPVCMKARRMYARGMAAILAEVGAVSA